MLLDILWYISYLQAVLFLDSSIRSDRCYSTTNNELGMTDFFILPSKAFHTSAGHC